MKEFVPQPSRLMDQVREVLQFYHRDVAVSTQNQALNAILFLYRDVLKSPVEAQIRALRSTRNACPRCSARRSSRYYLHLCQPDICCCSD